MPPSRCCSSVNEALKSALKLLPDEDAQGKLHPMRRLYACTFASGARDRAASHCSRVPVLCLVIGLLPRVSLRRTPATVRPRRPIAPRSGRCTALLSRGVRGSGPTPAHALGGRGAPAPHARGRGGDA